MRLICWDVLHAGASIQEEEEATLNTHTVPPFSTLCQAKVLCQGMAQAHKHLTATAALMHRRRCRVTHEIQCLLHHHRL